MKNEKKSNEPHWKRNLTSEKILGYNQEQLENTRGKSM